MIGLVVVTHGQLATELLNAAETIVGDLPHFAAVSIGWHEDVQDARNDIQAAITRVRERTQGVLIATDMFGGTPSNLAISVMEAGHIEVVAGMNLPMLIKLSSVRKADKLAAAVEEAQAAGRKYINVASQLLAAK